MAAPRCHDDIRMYRTPTDVERTPAAETDGNAEHPTGQRVAVTVDPFAARGGGCSADRLWIITEADRSGDATAACSDHWAPSSA
jgi:hypothetical protein